MRLLQRLKRNNKTHVAKWITALMAAILLAVGMTMPAWAAPDDDFEITIVALPQGYTHLEVGSDIGNAPSGPSKVMTTFGELKSKNRINIVTGQYTDKDGKKQNSFKFSSIGDATNASGSFTHNYYYGENDPAIDNLHTEYISKKTVDLFSDYFTDSYPWEYGVLYIKMYSLQPHSSYTNAKDTSNQYTDSYTYNQNNQFTGAVITAAYPNAGGSTSGDIQSYVSTETTITATANTNHTEDAPNGYRFDHWEKNGNYFSDQPSVSVMCNGSIDAYVAIFVKENEANGVFTKPDDPGHGTTSGDTYRTSNGQKVTQTTIQATPKSNEYVFDHWELTSDGDTELSEAKSKSNPLIVKVGDCVDTYTAVFEEVSKEDGVFTESNNDDWGTTSGDTYRMANGQKVSQTTIQATPKSNEYVFDHWELTSNGTTVLSEAKSKTNPLIVKVGDCVDTYTAVFKEVSKEDGVFTKSNNNDWGTTSGDTYRRANGQTISQTTIQATPESDEYKFDHWELTSSGTTELPEARSKSNPLIVKVGDCVDTYTAIFVKRIEENGVFTQPDDESHGTTSGDTYRKVNGQTINQTTIQAFPTSNEWIFSYWELISNGTSKGKIAVANPYTVKVKDSADLYIAHFRKRNEGGSGDLPSKNVKGKATGVTDDLIDVTKRDFSTPGLIVDRNYVAAMAQDTIGGMRSRYAFMSPFSGLVSRIESLSSKLAPKEKNERFDNDGFELVTAGGEIIDIETVSVDGKMKTQAEDAVKDKYGALYKVEILTAGDIPYINGFDDGSHTVFWSDTGAKKGDRLLLIQQLPDSASKTITPVVDAKGDVRFTTSDYIGSRFILLKISFNK